ncbi:unnamed protein product [Prunus armeniaca]|nr:unnamed protein product [Prunus armeniaca]
MNSFRQALVDCDLRSVPYQGYPFTWARTYPSGDMVEERLDRCVVNGRISADYGHILTYHLVASGSDHYPILGELLTDAPIVEAKKKEDFILNKCGHLRKVVKILFERLGIQLTLWEV